MKTGEIQMLDDDDATWSDDRVRQAMGLEPQTLEEAMAREAFRLRMAGVTVGDKPSALFDVALLNQTVQEEARQALAATPVTA